MASKSNQRENESGVKRLNRLVLHPDFQATIQAINDINLTIVEPPKPVEIDFSNFLLFENPGFASIGDIARIKLDAQNGQRVAKQIVLSGYDESKLNYKSLEGEAFFTAHSMVILNEAEYIPVTYLSFYFYTRSEELAGVNPTFVESADPISASNYHYVEDRNRLIIGHVVPNSILFIDGPLIGGNISAYSISMVRELEKIGVIPIFFVKNSDSDMVINNIPEYRRRYNSDLHWSYQFLDKGQRTNFFSYMDQRNNNNAKVFCYIRPFSRSPQRVEMHLETYQRNKKHLDDLMDLSYYLMLVHGNLRNPQIRPIAVAEQYAREMLRLTDSYNLIKHSGLIPTMNQLRFETK